MTPRKRFANISNTDSYNQMQLIAPRNKMQQSFQNKSKHPVKRTNNKKQRKPSQVVRPNDSNINIASKNHNFQKRQTLLKSTALSQLDLVYLTVDLAKLHDAAVHICIQPCSYIHNQHRKRKNSGTSRF